MNTKEKLQNRYIKVKEVYTRVQMSHHSHHREVLLGVFGEGALASKIKWNRHVGVTRLLGC